VCVLYGAHLEEYLLLEGNLAAVLSYTQKIACICGDDRLLSEHIPQKVLQIPAIFYSFGDLFHRSCAWINSHSTFIVQQNLWRVKLWQNVVHFAKFTNVFCFSLFGSVALICIFPHLLM